MKLSVVQLDLGGRRVFLRADFNVPLEKDTITDDTRIRSTLPTINHAVDEGARVILCSHLGRPKGKPDPRYSLAPVVSEVRDRITQHCCLTVGGEPAVELEGVPWGRWGCRQIMAVHDGRAYWLTFAPFQPEADTPSDSAARAAFAAFLRSFAFIPASVSPAPTITPVPTPRQ